MAELSVGDELAGYRVEAIAGRGGMGVVYRATDLTLDRPVALKLITDELAQDDAFRERFKRESRLAASIRHPNVITVFRAGEESGHLFIAMDYIEGTDLKTLIAERGRLAPQEAAQIVWQVGQALDAAHAKTLVHRDVKPANVLIADENGAAHAYLTDFGLTKDVSSESGMTKTGVVVGTIDYMAPEQVAGTPIDARADIYSLGCVLFEALTGSVPYPRDSAVAKMYAHTHEPPPSLTESALDMPDALDGVVARAMAKQREERYLSAGDLGQAAMASADGRQIELSERSVAVGAAALREGTEDQPTKVRTGGTTSAQAPPRRFRGRLALGAAALLAALVAAAVLLLAGGDGKPQGLSKDAYQDQVIDATLPFSAEFTRAGSTLPDNLRDPERAQQAAVALTGLRKTLDELIGRLEGIEAPADIEDVHAQVIAMVRKIRSDVADAGAAASLGDERVYQAVPARLNRDVKALDSLADDFAAKGYTRLSLGVD